MNTTRVAALAYAAGEVGADVVVAAADGDTVAIAVSIAVVAVVALVVCACKSGYDCVHCLCLRPAATAGLGAVYPAKVVYRRLAKNETAP